MDEEPLAVTVVIERPRRRWGVGDEDAILTLGREVEYRFPRRSHLAILLKYVTVHWDDLSDPLVQCFKRFFPQRKIMRSAAQGQFTGTWRPGGKGALKVEPLPGDDWTETAKRPVVLPKVRPRSPLQAGDPSPE